MHACKTGSGSYIASSTAVWRNDAISRLSRLQAVINHANAVYTRIMSCNASITLITAHRSPVSQMLCLHCLDFHQHTVSSLCRQWWGRSLS